MITNMLIGFPDQRPGGLLLSVMLTAVAFAGAVVIGYGYAVVCQAFPRTSLSLQGLLAALRGIPLLLLVFFAVQISSMPPSAAGCVALLIYALCHVGEILRSYRAAYPVTMAEQSQVLGLGRVRDEVALKAQWTLLRSFDSLGTQAISLLKDTGALTIVGIGELTTIARGLSAGASAGEWATTLMTAAALYLTATLLLVSGIGLLKKSLRQRVERLV